MRKSEYLDICCEIHKETVHEIEKVFPQEQTMFCLSDFFKLFGDNTRIKILYSLLKNELCVCDIAALLKMTISAISHQLKLLREANLVKTRREGKSIFYSLADEHVSKIIEFGMEHIFEKSEEE
ncbi:MAG: metalloregulator ArsR/SmtB family transcription factor [Spirochaetia bacterium]|nr:metalloregulator ArsR/SmtB family transcription factor [Spirochaetia bacterium]MDD7610166.1 metalloregulator ArsR/SmtB family transcription factor [Spirochaetales bacterium]MDY5915146.1 metalloregulator ArsR/SmtB family transcription factor [Treponema sp.]